MIPVKKHIRYDPMNYCFNAVDVLTDRYDRYEVSSNIYPTDLYWLHYSFRRMVENNEPNQLDREATD